MAVVRMTLCNDVNAQHTCLHQRGAQRVIPFFLTAEGNWAASPKRDCGSSKATLLLTIVGEAANFLMVSLNRKHEGEIFVWF